MESNNNLLTQKLDGFIRKHHANQLLRGALLFGAALMGVFLFLIFLDYLSDLSAKSRTALVAGFGVGLLLLLWIWVLGPGLKWLRVGKIMDHFSAAQLVGHHFSEINDQLLNTLQLEGLALSQQDQSLIRAAIEQKTQLIAPFDFKRAIDFSQNKKYLKYLVVPVGVFLTIYLWKPAVVQQSTDRLIHFTEEFAPIAPFEFVVVNPSLSAMVNEDFVLLMKTEGKVVPTGVKLETPNGSFRLKEESTANWSHTFRNIQQNTPFRFSAAGFHSPWMTIEAISKPIILQFETALNYPRYTGLKAETFKNAGDLVVPEGTQIRWKFRTQHTDLLTMGFDNVAIDTLDSKGGDLFEKSTTVFKATNYWVNSSNQKAGGSDTIAYSIKVVPDQYPSIAVSQTVDSLDDRWLFFKGNVSDDYGLNQLTLNYSITQASKLVLDTAINLSWSGGEKNGSFYHSWNLAQLSIEPGAVVNYHFTIWDNDGVNGSKAARSAIFTHAAPTEKELRKQQQEKSNELQNKLAGAKQQAKELQEEMEDLSQKLIDKKTVSWEDKEKIRELLQKQEQLEQELKNSKQQLEQEESRLKEQEELSESILEKQEQIQELFDELMSEEMKQMMEELEKLMEEMSKDQMQEQLEDMQYSAEEMEKELDRTLELYKRLDFEMQLERTIGDMEELAKKQEELSNQNDSAAAQQDLNEQFEELSESLEELEQKNQALEEPFEPFEKDSAAVDQIKNDQQEATDQLEKGKQKKANDAQQKAGEQMEQMAQSMRQMQQQMQDQQQSEDLSAVRQILENLIQLSFEQEAALMALQGLAKDNPREHKKDPMYVTLGQSQKNMQADARMIADSLFALSKRQPQIEAIVNKEIMDINRNMDRTLTLMTERKTPEVTERQQLIMTSVNNLALLFDEMTQQMQMQMAQQKYGDKACNKPGQGNKPSPMSMKQMQQQMSEMLKKMKEEAGKNPNGKKPGAPGPGGSSSEQLAKMAAEQQKLRNEIRKLAEQKANQNGANGKEALEEMQKLMEENERDIINKNITQETIRRQQEILTKMLESDLADREQDMDEQRQANEATQEWERKVQEFLEYQQLKEKEVELLKSVPPGLNSYYKVKVTEYFNKFGAAQ